jgi:hypothetical protein
MSDTKSVIESTCESQDFIDSQDELIFDNLVWLSSAEAAMYLRKSVGALRTAVSRNQILARKWRRRLYFKKSDLEKLLEGSFRKEGL